ncbi:MULTISPECIES: IclR family transcriptional regulator [unclassified Enterobacter]|jgi:DNA-binding IclR family transcriptional regulator|uniref:IclR family transcriptional regulator n=1 Tax=unclassified Enterobacter TaxID=2608935 RepID=UPI0015CD0E56|nr:MULTISPECIES: IclR family transcriptional regulator [unclassified Enterobacter]MBB3307092.1 DNA-binding IclR family transcriptional regulator [Enterobacter sp. Sphag1F]NYI15584.1 DNA-binding IclR family transcriptional regulator [Enterobacter sp. Sphag71]
MSVETETNGSQVIARAATILRALEDRPAGLTMSALAKITALPRTTVHRLVTSLIAQQLLLQDSDGIKLGPALARLAASAHTDIIALAQPAMATLGRRTRETVDLCVWRGSHTVLVSQCVSDQELRVASPVSTAFPSHCAAHGKALLAEQSEEALASLLPQLKEVRTEKTQQEAKSLLKDIAATRKQGYAIDREEHARGVCGISVALQTGAGERYALAIAAPALRFDEQFAHLLASLLQAKAEIEALVAR